MTRTLGIVTKILAERQKNIVPTIYTDENLQEH